MRETSSSSRTRPRTRHPAPRGRRTLGATHRQARRRDPFRSPLAREGVESGRGVMALQVGIGSGNTAGTFNGDHDLWRLPESDDPLTGRANRYLRNRPAFRANDAGDAGCHRTSPAGWPRRSRSRHRSTRQRPATRARRELGPRRQIFARGQDDRRDRRRRRHRPAARVLPGVVVARRPGAGRRRARLAGQALGDPRARVAARRGALGGAIPRHRGRRRHAQPVRHERARARRPGRARCARPAGRRLPSTSAGCSRTCGRSSAAASRARPATRSAPASIYDDFDAAPHTFGLVATARAVPAADRRRGATTPSPPRSATGRWAPTRGARR